LVKQESVNLTHQTIFGFIPYLNIYAIYRIQKLRRYILLGMAVFVGLIMIEVAIIFGIILTSEKSDLSALMEMYRSVEASLAHAIGGLIFSGYLTIRWSKKWNEKFEPGFSEETSKIVSEISRIFVASRWKKPNIYFTIPSIYLFISVGILVIGTVVKINDDYFLLSITTNLHLIILSIPSMMGAIQLWHRKKIGLIFSNISLIFLSLVMPTSIFWILQESYVISNSISKEMGIIFGLSIGLSVVMIWFLFKAKKQVLWNK